MRINLTYTVGANPINCATGLATAAQPYNTIMANRVFIQMLTAADAGAGYVLSARIGKVPPTPLADGNVSAELAASDGTNPGGSWSDADERPSGGIDLAELWVHGAHAGDKIKVSYMPRV